MTININKIFSVSSDSLLSAIYKYDIPFINDKIRVVYDQNQWIINPTNDQKSCEIAENAILKRLENRNIYIVNDLHKNKVIYAIKCIFGDEQKLENLKFKLLIKIDTLDLKTEEETVAILSDLNAGIRYSEYECAQTLITAAINIAQNINFSKYPFNNYHTTDLLLDTLSTALYQSNKLNKQELISTINYIAKNANFSEKPFDDVYHNDENKGIATKTIIILMQAIREADINLKQELISTINYIAENANFKTSPFNNYNTAKYLLYISGNLLEHSNTQNRQKLISTINIIVKNIDLNEDISNELIQSDDFPFNNHILLITLKTIDAAMKYSDADNKQELISTINYISKNIELYKPSFDDQAQDYNLTSTKNIAPILFKLLYLSIKNSNPTGKQEVISTINHIVNNIDFKISAFNNVYVKKELLNALFISVQHADNDNLRKLITTIINIHQKFNHNDILRVIICAMECLNKAIEYANADNIEPLISTIITIYQNANFETFPFNNSYAMKTLDTSLNSIIQHNDMDKVRHLLLFIVKHQSTTTRTLRNIFLKINTENRDLLFFIASHNNADAILLNDILTLNSSEYMVSIVLKNYNANENLLYNIAINPNTTAENLKILAQQKESTDKIYNAICVHNNAHEDVLKIVSKAKELDLKNYKINIENILHNKVMSQLIMLPSDNAEILDDEWNIIKNKFDGHLKTFFFKLESSYDYINNRINVRKRVARILKYIEKDDLKKEALLAILIDGSTDCSDAVMSALEKVETEVIIYNVPTKNIYKVLCANTVNEFKENLLKIECEKLHMKNVNDGEIMETYIRNLLKYKSLLGIAANMQSMNHELSGREITDITPIIDNIKKMSVEDLFTLIRYNRQMAEGLALIIQFKMNECNNFAKKILCDKSVDGTYADELYNEIINTDKFLNTINNELEKKEFIDFIEKYKICDDMTMQPDIELLKIIQDKTTIQSMIMCGFLDLVI